MKSKYIEKEYTDTMEKSFLSYAEEVLVNRAIPDLRDGLKPGQRRIIYAMDKLNLAHNKPYKKSARIIGDAMGKYHPHGDSSLYGSLVYMSQDFNLMIPLVDGHGNFGSIDGDAAAAMRYCVVGGTRLSTPKGLIKIKDLIGRKKEKEVNSQTKGIDTAFDVSKFFNSGKQETLNIKVLTGHQVGVSKNHPIMTYHPNEKQPYVWTTAEKLKVKDRLLLSTQPADTSLFGFKGSHPLAKELATKKGKLPEDFFKYRQAYMRTFFQHSFEKFGSIEEEDMIRLEVSRERLEDIKNVLLQQFGILTHQVGGSLYITHRFVVRFYYEFLQKSKEKSVRLIKEFIHKLEKELTKEEINAPYISIEITEIEEGEIEEVYSPKIEHQTHAYIANGFIHHNTEARLSEAGEKMLQNLDKKVVEFRENYDGTEMEPEILPARFPNLLVNGTFGIASGYRSYIPTHNPAEVADALSYLIQYGEKAKESLVLDKIKGPDYPYGGLIVNQKELKKMYKTGKGRVIMRGKYFTEKGEGGRTRIVFYELPQRVMSNKNKLRQDLIEKAKDKTLGEIYSISDESNREGIRLVIEVNRGTNMERFINKLWLYTDLQSTDAVHALVIHKGKPKTLSLLNYLEHYIEYQKQLHLNLHQYLLKETQKELEVIEGLLKAYSKMDVVLDTIRFAKSRQAMMDCLLYGKTEGIHWTYKKYENEAKKFHFTKRQAEAILRRQLRTLSHLDIIALEKEEVALIKNEKFHKSVLNDENVLKKELLKDVQSFRSAYPNERKTDLVQLNTNIEILEEKTARKVGVRLDRDGFITVSTKSKLEENPEYLLSQTTDTMDNVAIYTSLGNIYQAKIEDLPLDKKTTIHAFVQLARGEKILFATLGKEIAKGEYVAITKLGRLKKLKGKELKMKGFRSKTHYLRLNKGDEVQVLTKDKLGKWLVVETNRGRGGLIATGSEKVPIRYYGKGAKGSIVIKMAKGEYIKDVITTNTLKGKFNQYEIKQMPEITGYTVRKLK